MEVVSFSDESLKRFKEKERESEFEYFRVFIGVNVCVCVFFRLARVHISSVFVSVALSFLFLCFFVVCFCILMEFMQAQFCKFYATDETVISGSLSHVSECVSFATKKI